MTWEKMCSYGWGAIARLLLENTLISGDRVLIRGDGELSFSKKTLIKVSASHVTVKVESSREV